MIETHVVNTFLATSVRAESWFAVLNYLNGLVAPSFLFIAGFVQGMERRMSPGKSINYGRRAWRLFGLLALGYALHFPWAEIAQGRWDDALRVGTQVDVLQCLAMSLGLLLAVTRLAERRSDRSWWVGTAGLALGAVLVAPASADLLGLPVPLQAWVNRSTGSWFPLPSWAGFVFFGALIGAWPRRPIFERAAGIASLVVLAWACRGPECSPLSPASFLERAAWVLALAAFCEWQTRRAVAPLPLSAGRHSLTLYVVHLLLISWLVLAGLPSAGCSLPATLVLLVGIGLTSLAISCGVAWWRARPQRRLFLPAAPQAVAGR